MARNLLLGTALQTGLAFAAGLWALPAQAQPAANARPTGGTVVAGSASISRASSDTRIDQSSQRAAIDWRSFDVGARQSVTFAQPSASAVALNRVTGPDPSQIAGRIDANGQIILVNQSGVTFYQGAQVNAAGVMVSAANITNQNFMAGSMTFDQASRNPNARIDNRGSITVREAGLAALVAPQVANSGVITARLGHVVLAGAKTATLDLYGDGLLSLDVGNQVMQVPVGPDGKAATALVTNTGVIVADGGTVQLTARAADGLVQTLVQAGGTIQAASVGARTGVVTVAGVGGSVLVEGQLSAPGSAPGTMGGAVQVVADHGVTVAGTARIDASGQAGGGVVAIGTTLDRARGGPGATAAMTAANTTVKAGARVSANATGKGDGGRVVVLSKTATRMDGMIAARGGPNGGNGGFVETSGQHLGGSGPVDLSAPHGEGGTWLLDPDFLTITSAAGNLDGSFTGTVLFSDDAGASDTLSASVLNKFAGSNVVLQAGKTLTVDASFSLTTIVEGVQNLTLQAGGTLTVSPGVSVTASGNITLATGGAGLSPPPAQASPLIAINGSVQSNFGSISLLSGAAGKISIGAAGAVSASTINLNGGTGGIALTGKAVLGQANSFIHINSAGPVSQAATSTINAFRLDSSTGVNGNVSLLGSNNAIANIGSFTVTNGDLTVVNSVPLTLFGTISAGNMLFLETPGTPTAPNSITFGVPPGDGPGTPAILTATAPGGRISLVADAFGAGEPTSSITATGGTVEFAPAAPGAMSLGGGLSGVGVDNTVLALVSTGTLEIGGFTSTVGGSSGITKQATSIAIDGPVNLSGTTNTGKADTLRLDATGDITQDTEVGSLTVANLSGSAASATLNNFANAIDGLGGFTTSGDLTLVTGPALTINGPVTAGTLPAPNAANTATIDLTTFGSLTIGTQSAAGSINAGTVRLTANGGSITEPNGSIGANSFFAAASNEGPADVLLPSTGNKIAASTGITANTGDVLLVDDPTLVLSGSYTGNNLFFEVTLPGGSLQLGDAKAATLTANLFGRISLVADSIIVGNADSTITAPSGTLELAPFSPIHTSVAGGNGTGQLLVDPTLLSIIIGGGPNQLGTLRIGGFTDVRAGATTPVTSASGITIDGPVDLTNRAFELNLLANGPITEPGGPLAVTAVSGSSIGAFSLANPANAIAETAGITAVNGDVVVVSQKDLELLGAHTGNNLFFEVASAGSALVIGNGDSTVSLSAATGGRISLVADQITNPGTVGTISAPAGTLELAPFSAINTSVNGPTLAGQLLIDGQLLHAVTSRLDTLVIGGFTNAPAGATASTPSAGSVTIDGALDLAPLAATLNLEAFGAVTQAAPILNVGTLLGTTGSTALTNPGNTVATLGNYTATTGFAVTNATDLLIAGAVTTGGAAAFTIAGNLTETGSLTAAQLSGSTTGVTSLTGNNRVASLGNFTASNFALNNSADLLIAGAVTTPGTAAFTIAGALTETGSLTAAQLTGSTTGVTSLTGNNRVGSLGNFTASSFALNNATDLLIAGAVTTPGTAAFTIAGALAETGNLTAAQLTGSTTGVTSLTGNNEVASLGNFTASGFALNNGVDLLIAGELNAPNISILAPARQISLDNGATIVTTNALLQSTNFVQLGTSTVLGQGGGPATLQISTTGIQQFDPPLGLQATGATLILDLHGGFAAGAVFVNALDVRFTTPGGTNLAGTIAGIVGGPAAAAGHIQPAVNSAYLFNGCIIGAPTCGPTPVNAGLTATLGAIEPLVTLAPPTLTTVPGLALVALPMLQARPPQLTDPDVVPPNITYLDY